MSSPGQPGGASAAAADLARLRGGDEDLDPEEIEMLREGGKIFGDGEKILKTLRLYSREHPTMKQIIGALHERLKVFLGEYGTARLGLQARELFMDGHVIYSADRVDTNVWFPLFGGGIRQLSFTEGIGVDEFLEFFAILGELHEITDDTDNGEDDAVTLLWERDFEHVEFVSIDSFVEGQEADENRRLENLRNAINTCTMKELGNAALTGGAYENGEVMQRVHTIALSRADLVFLRQENLATLSELPTNLKQAVGQLFQIDDNIVAEFVAGCIGDTSIIERYIEALLDALPHSDQGIDTEALTLRLRDLFTAIVAQSNMDRAHRMLSQLTEAKRIAGNDLDGIERKIVSEDALINIVAILARGVNEEETERTIAVIRGLTSWAAPVVLKKLDTVSDPALQRRLLKAAAIWGDDAARATADVIGWAREAYAHELVAFLQDLGGEEAVAALGAALRHASAAVQVDATRAYLGNAARNLAEPRARAGLRGDNPTIRRIALEYVVAHRPANGAVWVLDRIQHDSFDEAKLIEKKRLLLAYAQIGGERATEWLMGKLQQRSLLGRGKSEEVRAVAGWALAQLHHKEARPLIEQLAKKKFSKEVIKETCVEALRAYESPVAAPAARPAPQPRPAAPQAPPTTAAPVTPAPRPRPAPPRTVPATIAAPIKPASVVEEEDDVALIVDSGADPGAPELPTRVPAYVPEKRTWSAREPSPIAGSSPGAEPTMPVMPAAPQPRSATDRAPDHLDLLDLTPNSHTLSPEIESDGLLTLLPEEPALPETIEVTPSANLRSLLSDYLTDESAPSPPPTSNPPDTNDQATTKDDGACDFDHLLRDYLDD